MAFISGMNEVARPVTTIFLGCAVADTASTSANKAKRMGIGRILSEKSYPNFVAVGEAASMCGTDVGKIDPESAMA